MRAGLRLSRWWSVRQGEGRLLAWSFIYFFFLLTAYYLLRPVRDEMGVAGGVRNLHWLFTATFLVMLAAVPVYGALVARLPRRRFVPMVYHFFALNLVLFWILIGLDMGKLWLARAFFVWISVFNLFAVSVFWSYMADLFSSEQGKRLFGIIAAGGSAGALCGPALALVLAAPLGPVHLMALAAVLLELAVLAAARLETAAQAASTAPARSSAGAENGRGVRATDASLGGGWLAGIALIARSRYLAGIALWVCLLSLAGTFLYFQQANIVAAASDDPAVRTRMFAGIDLAVGILTLLVQLSVTASVIARVGVGMACALLPLVFALGFVAIAWAPILAVVIAFQALQRAVNFALSNPAREVLFTVVGREEKYKAKNVIDIVVFRGADALSGWLFAFLRGLGMDLSGIALASVPIAGAWFALALVLGRAHEAKAAQVRAGAS